MRILTDPDLTQESLLPYLLRTEQLLAQASSLVSGREREAEISVMPDLGLPHNVQRIHGGFLTGAYYRWTGDTPMVPVDATVNVCGVSVFRLERAIPTGTDFHQRVVAAKRAVAERTPYRWNYDSGNHFVTLTEIREPGSLPVGQYLVLHASSAEFKHQYNGLYPDPENWYSHEVKSLEASDGRYLRYLSGTAAEKFSRTAKMLESYQRERQRTCAELVAGPGGISEEILSIPHYGMPDENSVAIGCQWLPADDASYLLLTRPGSPLYLIDAHDDGNNHVSTAQGHRILTPHGLGVKVGSPFSLAHDGPTLRLLDRSFPTSASLAGENFTAIRDFEGDMTVKSLLRHCPGEITAVFHQLHSHYRQGPAA